MNIHYYTIDIILLAVVPLKHHLEATCLRSTRVRGTGSGFLRKSTGANEGKRFSAKTYRKPVLFLHKSPKISRSLREFTGDCNIGILYPQLPLTYAFNCFVEN